MHSKYIKKTQYRILGEGFSRLKNKAPSFSTKLHQHQGLGITETTGTTTTSATDASESQPHKHWTVIIPDTPTTCTRQTERSTHCLPIKSLSQR